MQQKEQIQKQPGELSTIDTIIRACMENVLYLDGDEERISEILKKDPDNFYAKTRAYLMKKDKESTNKTAKNIIEFHHDEGREVSYEVIENIKKLTSQNLKSWNKINNALRIPLAKEFGIITADDNALNDDEEVLLRDMLITKLMKDCKKDIKSMVERFIAMDRAKNNKKFLTAKDTIDILGTEQYENRLSSFERFITKTLFSVHKPGYTSNEFYSLYDDIKESLKRGFTTLADSERTAYHSSKRDTDNIVYQNTGITKEEFDKVYSRIKKTDLTKLTPTNAIGISENKSIFSRLFSDKKDKKFEVPASYQSEQSSVIQALSNQNYSSSKQKQQSQGDKGNIYKPLLDESMYEDNYSPKGSKQQTQENYFVKEEKKDKKKNQQQQK